MVEYLPWSNSVLNRCVSLHNQNKLSTVDLELSAKCTGACCIYCDSKPVVGSPMPDELSWAHLQQVLQQSVSNGLEWIYTCGLGEPLEDDSFFKLLEFVKKNNVRISMFSNGIFIDSLKIAAALKAANVNIVLKMDTFNSSDFDKILGYSGVAEKIYKALDFLLSAGYGAEFDSTDLAFSIVPTRLSIEGIPEVLAFAEKNGIFASIGELESAGSVIIDKLDAVLELDDERIADLKNLADRYAGKNYMRPICPSIVTGIHIDNLGRCIVDRQTGLNCKWFLLKEPDVHIIGNTKEEAIFDLFIKVKKYRAECFKRNAKIIGELSNLSFIFGGCGGNPKDIIRIAKEAM